MPKLTVCLPTYNRVRCLERALHALLGQGPGAPPCRLLVVDNNSGDGTRELVARFGPTVEYLFEPRQGLSYARNAAVEFTATEGHPGDLLAFTDDDVEVAPDWGAVVLREFDEHRDVECIGGRVLPRWPAGAPPAWLTAAHWAPLALQDHGDVPAEFSARCPGGLIGANLVFRRSAFDRAGLFAPAFQRVRDGIGSTEDHEWLLRFYAAGGRARYAPALVVTAPVDLERLSPGYHRRWHRGHGRFHALMRVPAFERSRRAVGGVPAHVFRAVAWEGARWIRGRVTGDRAAMLAAEMRLCFYEGFVRQRWSRR